MTTRGSIAAGHPETAEAAAVILREGGNAFDAVLAALCTACVAEPVLASLGGGGFLMARRPEGAPVLYDFFVQTPKRKPPADAIDLFPILADFGDAQQEFHMGMGALATPGVVRGLFAVQRDLGSMPMARIVEPAVALARRGHPLAPLQAYIFSIVQAIYLHDARCRTYFASPTDPDRLIGEGETLTLPVFADILETLAHEGEDLFYRGEIAARIVDDCRGAGGCLTMDDFADYRVARRAPLALDHRGARLLTNPPPSTGGLLIAFALELLRDRPDHAAGSVEHLAHLARVMDQTNRARVEACLHERGEAAAEILLRPDFVEAYRAEVAGRPAATRGTTHISVIDAAGNAASLTLTNGEGSGYIVPGTGIVMNNMLGEEDINPHGFNQWPEDTRMCSMMAPSVLTWPDGRVAALGSGGSNRIRTAILQVLIHLLDFGLPVEAAVAAPRLHQEGELLSIEGGFDPATVAALQARIPQSQAWQDRNLFFGGVHTVLHDPATGRFEGAGDPRRGGAAITV